MKSCIRHLVECHCTLPQFRDRKDIVYHRFIVFSEIDENDNVVSKFAQCNNCGVVHRVIDVGHSEILSGLENNASIISINDIKVSLPSNIISVLESYSADVSIWECVAWVIANKAWDTTIILSSEDVSGVVSGKCLRVDGPNSIRIEPFSNSFVFPQH